MIFQIILAIVFAYPIFQPLFSYFYDAKGLRKYPSPSFAGISSLWRIGKNIQKKHYLAIHKAHKELGTHVRIAPNHISISDPAAVTDIYGHGANFLKEGFYDGGGGVHRDLGTTRVKAEHQAKRKMFAQVFAQKTIANLEPVVNKKVTMLVEEIDKKTMAGQPVNIRRYLNYFAIDLISELLYGQSLGCMRRGSDLVDAETPDGLVYKTSLIKSLHLSTIISTILGMEASLLPYTKKLFAWHPYTRAGSDFGNIVYHNVKKRLQKSDANDDIFQRLMTNSKGEALNLPREEILAESGVIMNAGTDTTTAALTGTVFLLYKHPEVLTKLRAELDPVMGGQEVPQYDTVANLPYLRACIEESLRVRPASTMGLPRVVPTGGRTIAGKFVEEGVTVSVPTYTLLRNPQAFDDADTFNPDRWISGDKQRMSKAHFPFSTGPRACIGRNIAYFEQILVIATLAHLYDFELPSPDFELKTIERFNANPDELIVRARRRI